MGQNYNSSLDKLNPWPFTDCLATIKPDRNKVPWKFWAVLERGKERNTKIPGRNFSKPREEATTTQTTFSYNGCFYNRGRIILKMDKVSMAVFICKLH